MHDLPNDISSAVKCVVRYKTAAKAVLHVMTCQTRTSREENHQRLLKAKEAVRLREKALRKLLLDYDRDRSCSTHVQRSMLEELGQKEAELRAVWRLGSKLQRLEKQICRAKDAWNTDPDTIDLARYMFRLIFKVDIQYNFMADKSGSPLAQHSWAQIIPSSELVECLAADPSKIGQSWDLRIELVLRRHLKENLSCRTSFSEKVTCGSRISRKSSQVGSDYSSDFSALFDAWRKVEHDL